MNNDKMISKEYALFYGAIGWVIGVGMTFFLVGIVACLFV